MPFSIYYSLVPPAAAETGGVGEEVFSTGGARLLCDVGSQTQEEFLALLERVLPNEYLQPMKRNANAGYEIFQAIAALGERLSTAVRNAECGQVISYATTGSYATVDVVFYRPTYEAGAVTVRRGTIVSTSNDAARRFRTTEDAVFGAFDLEVTVSATAVAKGFLYNVPGQRLTPAGVVLPGEIDKILIPLLTPRYGETTLQVKQLVDAVDGSPSTLTGHGSDRGLTQASGESESAFRERIRTLPDVVVPAALRRIAGRILGPLNIAWELIETWSQNYLTCFDAPSENAGTPTYNDGLIPPAPFSTNNFVYDDPRDPRQFVGRWLGEEDYRGAFIFVINTEGANQDTTAFFLDDPALAADDFDIGGRIRGNPALDIPQGTGPLVVEAALDGIDLTLESAITAFGLAIQSAKAAGVDAAIDYPHEW